MKPDWDKLMGDYNNHATTLVADVDCTAAGKPLCDANGVKGFPTIKYGDPASLEDYKGGRKYDDLAKFAKDLKPVCSPGKIDLCDDAQKAEIEKIQAMPDADLESAISEKEKQIADAEAKFKTETEKLQKKYKALEADKKATVEGVKKGGLGMLKSVKAYNKDRPKCRIPDTKDCSDKEKQFYEKFKGKTKEDWEKQITRLQKMVSNPMKAELRLWFIQRLNILRQLNQ